MEEEEDTVMEEEAMVAEVMDRIGDERSNKTGSVK